MKTFNGQNTIRLNKFNDNLFLITLLKVYQNTFIKRFKHVEEKLLPLYSSIKIILKNIDFLKYLLTLNYYHSIFVITTSILYNFFLIHL